MQNVGLQDLTPSELRQAAAGDWAAVAALLTAATLPLDGAREHLDHFVVAERNGHIVGCAGIEPYGDAALLRSVAVAASERGQGTGQQLVAASLARATDAGMTRVVLRTTSADRFFARLGFERISPDAAPDAVKASSQFNGVCSATAITMQRTLLAR